ncbi:MAG TPA: alpha/beta hydrolase [Acidimicrobiia bacterium]|nr:alpha/beta hydrolase [Acidimicrobiia bacterium]
MTDTIEEGALHVTRTIPVPGTVSPQAQAALAGAAPTVMTRLAAPDVYPAADDAPGWKARIAQMDEAIAMGFGFREPAGDVDVEKIRLGDVDVYVITPEGADTGEDAPFYYDIHGGALIAGGGDVCRMMGVTAALRTGLFTWSVDYRMPPDFPYPTPLDDCLAVYRAVLELRSPDRIVVGGASAGGNLAAALLLKARAEGLPMPACLVLISPEVDLTESGDTFETNQGVDTVLVSRLTSSIALYANGHDLTDPFLSPIFGDVSGFPPTFVQAGTRDLFLSNAVRLHRALRAADVDAELHVWEAMPHGGFFGAPEDAEVGVEVRKFLAEHV